MSEQASELARRLAQDAEAVCRHYLSNGRREGRYWLVGDVRNTPGRSLFVRLKGAESGKGAAGKWTDAATGDHGDLLDVIRQSCRLADFHDVVDEARRFLELPRPKPMIGRQRSRIVGAAGIRGIRAATVRHVAADFGHNRGSVFAQTRHYGFARNRKPPLPSPLLLPARRLFADRDLARDDRRRHRSRRQDHRRASDLARPGRTRQGADRNAEAGDGPSSRQRRPLRRRRARSWPPARASKPCCRSDASCRPCRWRRRFRPHTSPPSCFPRPCAASTSPATTIPRATARWRRLLDRATRGRDRGDRLVAATRGLQRRPPNARRRCATGGAQDPARARRTSHASWSLAREPARKGEVGGERRSRMASDRGASRPVGESRAHGLLERATVAASGPARQWRMADYFPSRAASGAFHREAK